MLFFVVGFLLLLLFVCLVLFFVCFFGGKVPIIIYNSALTCININNYFEYYCVFHLVTRAIFSSVVRASARGALGRRIDPSWWTH